GRTSSAGRAGHSMRSSRTPESAGCCARSMSIASSVAIEMHTMTETKKRKPRTVLTKDDLYWFNEGTHNRLYQKLGAHLRTTGGVDGTNFAVWAPNAERVSVIGDFNEWRPGVTPLSPCGSSGIW